MGAWYWIGVCAGLGVGVGVLLAGLRTARTRIAAIVLAGAAGAAIGFGIEDWRPGGWGDRRRGSPAVSPARSARRRS